MTVWRVGDPVAPRFGTSDPEILDWCAINGFALVTNNRSSMPRHLQEHMGQGKEAPAIFVLRPDLSMEQTVGELHLIWAASEPHEFINIIWYLPLFS